MTGPTLVSPPTMSDELFRAVTALASVAAGYRAFLNMVAARHPRVLIMLEKHEDALDAFDIVIDSWLKQLGIDEDEDENDEDDSIDFI